MNCHYCRGVGTVEEEITTFSVCDIPRPFVVENVPAFVCYLCGDTSFSSHTIKAMDKIKHGEVQASASRLLLVFDFRDLEEPTKFSSKETLQHTLPVNLPKESMMRFLKEVPPWQFGGLLLISTEVQNKAYIYTQSNKVLNPNLRYTQIIQGSKHDHLRAWQEMG